MTTRGSNAYVTFAGSDTVGVVKNDRQTAFAATGIPGGAGQHSPCWIAVVGPYLFTTNSPSRSVSRLIAGGTKLHVFSPAIMEASYKATMELHAETVKSNENFKKVNDSMMAFTKNAYQWFRLSENSYDQFMMRAMSS